MTNDMFGIDDNRPWPPRPLAPLQGAGNVWFAASQGIGRRWLSLPWAMLSAPVGGIPLFRPNGPEKHSPGLSEAMPWDYETTRFPRPNGAREPAACGVEVER